MYRVFPKIKSIQLVAIAFAVATIVVSCKDKEPGEPIDFNKVPVQIVQDVNAVQTKDGLLQMRMEARLMQRFDTDQDAYELFPDGFDVYAYNEQGLLETHIRSDIAKHTTTKKDERWEAFGNVVISNFVKGERVETDTLFWDRENKRIYNNTCFVKMFSPDGFMQGYGMESDEMARNATVLLPFDSYGIIQHDSAAVYIDTVNFIGPVLKQ